VKWGENVSHYKHTNTTAGYLDRNIQSIGSGINSKDLSQVFITSLMAPDMLEYQPDLHRKQLEAPAVRPHTTAIIK
jgi:hypothetical protein